MAVTRTGSVATIDTGTTTNTGSASVTVPADAQLAVVVLCGYHSSAGYFSGGSLTLGGFTMLEIAADSNDSVFYGELAYLVNPPTGSQTLAWDWAGTSDPLFSPCMTVSFYKGLDTGNPLRSQYAGQSSGTSWSSTSLTALSGDLIVASASIYGQFPSSWTNATSVTQVWLSDGRLDLAENSSPSGDTTVGFSTASSSDGALLAIVIRQVSAAADRPGNLLNSRTMNGLTRSVLAG